MPRTTAVGVLLAGIIAALLAPFQFFAFPATYLIVLLYVATTGAWRVRTVLRDAVLFLAPVILAAPFIIGAIVQQRDIGAFRFVLGWGEARLQDGPAAVAFFYLTNLGIPFLLAVIAAVTARRLPGRWFLVAWMVALFIVPNVVVVSAVVFDMNKYFQIMWIAVAILAAWLINRWPRPIIAAVLIVSAFSPALIGLWHLRSSDVTVGLAQETAAHWIAANTPERSVFITDPNINSPVDLSGRLRITTFGPYVSNLGYDPDPRALDTTAIYCDGPEVAAERMAVYGATYVLSSGGDPCNGGERTDFSSSPLFETVYDQGRGHDLAVGRVLMGLGAGLALGLDDDRDFRGHPAEDLDRDLVRAERLERLLEVDLVAVDLDPAAGQCVGDVLRRDRAV